jgi:hypothetical protein
MGKSGIITLIIEIVCVIVIMWIAFIVYADRDRKPIVTCWPVYYTVGFVERTFSAATEKAAPQIGQRKNIDAATLSCLRFADNFYQKKGVEK